MFVYLAVVAELFDGGSKNYILGVYDSYDKAKSEVFEYITRLYLTGDLKNRVLIPYVSKQYMNGGLFDEWSGKELLDNNYNDEKR